LSVIARLVGLASGRIKLLLNPIKDREWVHTASSSTAVLTGRARKSARSEFLLRNYGLDIPNFEMRATQIFVGLPKPLSEIAESALADLDRSYPLSSFMLCIQMRKHPFACKAPK
jgi:hypothetical protein